MAVTGCAAAVRRWLDRGDGGAIVVAHLLSPAASFVNGVVIAAS